MFQPFATLIIAIVFLVQRKKGNPAYLIILYLIILILGDSRQYILLFSKDLRVVCLILFTLFTISDLLKRRYSFNPLFLWVIPFFILSIFAIPGNPAPGSAFLKSISYLMMLFVACHYLNHHIRKLGSPFIRDIIYLSVCVLALGLILDLTGSSIARFNLRYRGVFGNPNGMGIYCFLMFMIYLFYFYYVQNSKGQLYRIAFAILLISLFMSFSRNSLLSVILFTLLLQVFKWKVFWRYFFYLMLIPIVIFLASPENIIGIIKSIGLEEELRVDNLMTGSGRLIAWQWGWELFSTNRWIGGGFGYEEHMFIHFLPDWVIEAGHQGAAHNSYLGFLINNGILGTFLILGFYLNFVFKIKKKNLRIALIFATIFSSFFEPWLNSSLNAFTTHFLIMVLFAIHIQPNPNNKSRKTA